MAINHLSGAPAMEMPQSGLYLQFLEYVDIARIREEKYRLLISARFELAQNYIQERKDFDGSLIANHHDNLVLFQGQLPNFDQLAPAERELETAKLLGRKKILAYLLDNREMLVTRFRQHFLITSRENVTYQEIISSIAEEVVYSIFHDLTPQSRSLLLGALNNPETPDSHSHPGEAIFHLCRAYPPLENSIVNLYQKEDLEAFFGHLVGTVSGVGKNLWQKFQHESEALEMQLGSFKPRVNALPLAEYFGKLAEPMSIFLIQESMREAIEASTTTKPTQAAISSQDTQQLFSDFGKTTDNLTQLLQQFSTMPANSAALDKVLALIGKPTRRSLLSGLRKTLPGDLPLNELHQVMANIIQINSLRNNNSRGGIDELAIVFLMELETAMRFFNERTANFTLLEDLNAFKDQLGRIKTITEYTLQQLNADSRK